jgi:replicative DNA helicase
VAYYIDIVRDKYILRQIITAATESVRRAYEEQDEVGNLLDEVEQRIFAVGEDRFKGQMLSMKDQVMGAIESIEKLYERKGAITGISTGFAEFDRMTSGMHPSEMIVIAARPSMGKTAFAMNIAEHVTIQEKLPVGVFSLEMSSQQLVQRLLCSRARVNLRNVREGFLGERDFPSLTAAASKLAEAKMFIDDSASLSILELRAKARRLKAQQDVQLIVVDYLQLLRSASRRAQENRQLEISEISAGLKGLAKELKIPIIVVAQLNRQPETRSRGEPRLSDLRESGSIEQDADLVGLLLRPGLYGDDDSSRDDKDEASSRDDRGEEAELIIAKQRNGPIGKIDLTFMKEFTRFETRARDMSEPEEAF